MMGFHGQWVGMYAGDDEKQTCPPPRISLAKRKFIGFERLVTPELLFAASV
jgi:hypothetical protein